ncbi:MAG: class I SAM-dependent methyltransferase [Bacteroidales bacterium]|jgi:SAM-dependent methyltransferase|nr:class I SAM-dependent methyltransferase [Bacteroidales bacterium]
MNNPKCPLCSSSKTKFYLKSKDYFVLNGNSPDFQIHCCDSCKNCFTIPYMTNEELSAYYPEDYNPYKSFSSFGGFLQKLKSLKDIRIIKNKLREEDKSILEIGAGSGMFLNLLKQHYNNIDGVEPSKSGVDYAKTQFNIDLEYTYFEEYEFKKKYDLIIAFHVLEHFTDPISILNKISINLSKDGLLFIKVPRMDSWAANIFGPFWHGYDLPRHRFHFSKNGLIELLKKNNFQITFFKNDVDPLGTVRAMKFFSLFSKNKITKWGFKILNLLPFIIKLFFATIFEIVMIPFKSGRMSIIAQKISDEK